MLEGVAKWEKQLGSLCRAEEASADAARAHRETSLNNPGQRVMEHQLVCEFQKQETQKRIWQHSVWMEQKSRILLYRTLCKSGLDFWTKSQPAFRYHYAQATKWPARSFWIEISGSYLNFCSLQVLTCKAELQFWCKIDCDPGGFVAVN